MKIKPGFEDFVFISNFGKNISRIMVFHIIKELAERIGLKKKKSVLIPSAILLRHTCWKEAPTCVPYSVCLDTKVSTTEIYTHIDRNMLRSEIIEHHPRNIKFREKGK